MAYLGEYVGTVSVTDTGVVAQQAATFENLTAGLEAEVAAVEATVAPVTAGVDQLVEA